MKKLLLFTTILFLFLSSQGLSQFRLKLGPNTGMNFNIATGSDVEETANGLDFSSAAQWIWNLHRLSD
jgi:hypothetical protein